MSIRLVQLFWNLAGGRVVLRGGYHAPTEAETHEVEDAVDQETVEDVDSPPTEALPPGFEVKSENGDKPRVEPV